MKTPSLNKISQTLLIVSVMGLTACKTSTRYSRSTGEYWDDKTVAHNVKKGLRDDSLLKATDIDVKSFRGNVVLSGFVDHPLQKEEAGAVARATPGVHWFQNNLSVKDNLPAASKFEQGTIQESAGAEAGGKWEKGAFNQTSHPAAADSQRMNESSSAPSKESTPKEENQSQKAGQTP